MINARPEHIRAKGAFNGTSWSPEAREEQIVNDYLGHMTRVSEEFAKWATPENTAQLAADLEAYRQGYAQRLNAYLGAHSRVVSQFITGAGGWTGRMIRANDKRNDTLDRRREELTEYSTKQLDRLRRQYDPVRIARAPISSSDDDATERLAEKIEAAQRWHETMKAANKAIRGLATYEERFAALAAMGLDSRAAHDAAKPDYMGRVGFPSYALQNSSANIRRMKERIKEIEALNERKAEAEAADGNERTVEIPGVGTVTYLENTDEDRVQLSFPGKPPRDVIDTLKANGFKWAPSQGAWQRMLNANGINAANYVLAKLADR